MALRIEQSKPHDEEKGRGTLHPHHHDEEGAEELSGSPNDKVRAATGQPGVQAAVPLSQIPTPNQIVRLNISHKAA